MNYKGQNRIGDIPFKTDSLLSATPFNIIYFYCIIVSILLPRGIAIACRLSVRL